MIRAKHCILLPVLNEVSNIDSLLAGIGNAMRDQEYMICLVDDGSRDGTVKLINAAMQKPDHRLHLIQRKKAVRGSQRGSALFVAMMWALQETDCRFMVEMDGDLSHRPEELGRGLALLEAGRADVVIASKYLPGSLVTNRPVGRLLVSRICNLSVRVLISNRISDYSNGYRFYTRRAAELVADTHIHYASPIYLTEVMAIWISHGLRVAEFPTHYVGRNEGLSKLRIIDLIKAGLAVFEILSRLRLLGFAPANRMVDCSNVERGREASEPMSD
jgi:dolichol-phosphate mannosyltransferase